MVTQHFGCPHSGEFIDHPKKLSLAFERIIKPALIDKIAKTLRDSESGGTLPSSDLQMDAV